MPPPPRLQCDELRFLYEGERLTTLQIAALYGCSATTAGNWLRRCGIVLRDTRFKERSIPPDELERLYVVERRPPKLIAQHFGVSVGTIYNRLRAYNLSRKGGGQMAEARAGYRWGGSRAARTKSLKLLELQLDPLVAQRAPRRDALLLRGGIHHGDIAA